MIEVLVNDLKELIKMISYGEYDKIISSGRGGELSANEIEAAIKDYTIGGSSVEFQEPAEKDINLIPYSGSGNSGVIEYDFIIDGETSDLTLTCNFDEARSPILVIESIHVL